jgi:energy-converting hydrogenase A subunit R
MKTSRRVQVDSDCEGPLCLNDNAFEVCDRYIPNGERFFTQVSRYDDYLADVVRREGYEAGSTLKLVAPFLKAFGLTNEAMLAFSRGSVDMMGGAGEMFDHVRSLGLPAFVVSTSYQQFAHAVAERLRLPLDDVYCTPFDLDGVSLPESEADELQALARRIAEAPPIELPEDGGEEISPPALQSIALMEEIFWQRLPTMNAQTIIDSVRLLGAEGKAHAIRMSLERTDYSLADVVYVGDSITDVKAFELVRNGGGLTVSFNGNRYAVDAAEIACAADDAVATSILIDLFARHGRQGALELASRWPDDRSGQIALLNGLGVSLAVVRRLESLTTRGIHIERVTDETKAAIRTRSAEMRVLLRGQHIGNLG